MRLTSSNWFAAAILAGLASLPSHGQEPQPGGPGGPGGRGGRGGGPGGGFPQLPILMALDANGDGELSASEIDNAASAPRTLDKNKDGKLTRDEMLPAFREGGPGGPNPQELVTRMMAFDKNGDGKLSKDELPGRMQNLLNRADANKDGFVDRDEPARLAGSPIGFGYVGGSGAVDAARPCQAGPLWPDRVRGRSRVYRKPCQGESIPTTPGA